MACSHCRNLDQEEYREWDWHNGSWHNGSCPLSKTSVHNILEPINPVPSPCPVRFPCSVNTPLMTNLEFRGFLNHYLVWIGKEKLNINFAHFPLDTFLSWGLNLPLILLRTFYAKKFQSCSEAQGLCLKITRFLSRAQFNKNIACIHTTFSVCEGDFAAKGSEFLRVFFTRGTEIKTNPSKPKQYEWISLKEQIGKLIGKRPWGWVIFKWEIHPRCLLCF